VDGGPGSGDEVIYLDASGRKWLIGGPFDDSLTGSEASDAIFGADGNDTIDALGGDDAPAGGAGDDAVDGGSGFDFMPNYSLPVYYGFPPPAVR
jgi:Ca2+-binding RTX toxin-like protein